MITERDIELAAAELAPIFALKGWEWHSFRDGPRVPNHEDLVIHITTLLNTARYADGGGHERVSSGRIAIERHGPDKTIESIRLDCRIAP